MLQDLFIPLIITGPFSCCHGELLLLSRKSGGAMCPSPRARAKNNWCLVDPKLLKISLRFWHFHLKGHSWLSAHICDAAGEANYSDRKTMREVCRCFRAAPAGSFLSSFAVLIAFYSVSLMRYQRRTSQRGGLGTHHRQMKPNNGCLASGDFAAVFSRRRSRCPCEATASLQM